MGTDNVTDPAWPKLNDAEQEVMLNAVANDELVHVLWGVHWIVDPHLAQTDSQIRLQVADMIRKLIALGWIRLERQHREPLPETDWHTAQPPVGPEITIKDKLIVEPVGRDDMDRVLNDAASWEPHSAYETAVALAVTDQGGDAVSGGVIDDAYEKFLGRKETWRKR